MRNHGATYRYVTNSTIALALGACASGTRGDDPAFGPGIESEGDADEDDDAAGEDADADDGATTGAEPPAGFDQCRAIDLLFVVESAAWEPQACSWHDYYAPYERLDAGFEALTRELVDAWGVDDVRTLVTGSMAPDFAPIFEASCDLELPPQDSIVVDACDGTLGAGRNGYAGLQGILSECTTERWIEASSVDDMADAARAFNCVVFSHLHNDPFYAFGGSGDDTMMDATLAALRPDTAAGSCNAGFVRDDALLVVVLVELGDDARGDTSGGNAQAWHDALVAAKGGEADDVVVLGLVPDGDLPDGTCPATGAVEPFAVELRTFVDGFEYGAWGSSCALSYDDFFRDAAALIGDACDRVRPLE
jgi:hypothetical protein